MGLKYNPLKYTYIKLFGKKRHDNDPIIPYALFFLNHGAGGPKPVATPARTSASVPSVASVAPPTKANGAPPIGKGTMVKTEGLGVLPPPVTSLTPVKSPIQKKPKSAMPEQPHVIKRSLCTEMDDAASASSPPMSTVLDSSLEPPPTGKPVPWFKKKIY